MYKAEGMESHDDLYGALVKASNGIDNLTRIGNGGLYKAGDVDVLLCHDGEQKSGILVVMSENSIAERSAVSLIENVLETKLIHVPGIPEIVNS
jgi:hypothetical protein